jgi:hypothetical protein
MNLETIEVPEKEARAAVAEYLRAVRHGRDRVPEDAEILRGYRVLARGQRLIKLTDAIQAGGFFPDGLPRIAIADALAERVFGGYEYRLVFHTRQDRWGAAPGSAMVREGVVRVDVECPVGARPSRHETIVPLVPPRFRPVRGLTGYHVLFEVEEWKPVPPVDPALLKHIGGDLWAVLATWDLTPLERAVLAHRG